MHKVSSNGSQPGRIALSESADMAILTLYGDIDAALARGLHDSLTPSRSLTAALGGSGRFQSFEDCESAVAWLRTASLPVMAAER